MAIILLCNIFIVIRRIVHILLKDTDMPTSEFKKFLQRSCGSLWSVKRTQFNFPQLLEGGGKFLIVLPRNAENLSSLSHWRERLLFTIGSKEIIVLSIGVPLEYVQEWSGEYLFFTDSDINSLGLASQRVIDAVKRHNFKIAFNLSADFDFITAQIPLRAKIPFRMGIIEDGLKNLGEKFFNITLQRSQQIDYENIAKLLSANRT